MDAFIDNQDAKIAQLALLQTRLIAHGSKLWQLPFSYTGIVAVSVGLFEKSKIGVPVHYAFYALGVVGLIVIYCMAGAYEGYGRTAKFMRIVESDLGLQPSTNSKISHSLPYFLLAGAATLATFCLGYLSN